MPRSDQNKEGDCLGIPQQCDGRGMVEFKLVPLESPRVMTCPGCSACAWRRIKAEIPHFHRGGRR